VVKVRKHENGRPERMEPVGNARSGPGGSLDAPQPEELIATIVRETMDAAIGGQGCWNLQSGNEMRDCSRAIAVIPLSPNTFDALFNGRSGYRAQYYLSSAEGIRFNRMLVRSLIEPIKAIFDIDPRRQDWNSVKLSIEGPWSKVWVHGDSKPFADAPDGQFRPRRWANRAEGSIWLRAPLPASPAVEIKGTWISDIDGGYKQDPDKADRDDCMSERGFA